MADWFYRTSSGQQGPVARISLSDGTNRALVYTVERTNDQILTTINTGE